MPDEPKLLTTQEVAARLRVGVVTVWRHIRSGKLPAAKFSKIYLVRESDLNALLASTSQLEGREAGTAPAQKRTTKKVTGKVAAKKTGVRTAPVKK